MDLSFLQGIACGFNAVCGPRELGDSMFKLISVVAVAVIAMPVAAYAASTQQQLNSLQTQIDALQAQVNAIELTPGPQGEKGPDGPEGPEGPAGAGAPGGGNAFQLTVAGDPSG